MDQIYHCVVLSQAKLKILFQLEIQNVLATGSLRLASILVCKMNIRHLFPGMSFDIFSSYQSDHILSILFY